MTTRLPKTLLATFLFVLLSQLGSAQNPEVKYWGFQFDESTDKGLLKRMEIANRQFAEDMGKRLGYDMRPQIYLDSKQFQHDLLSGKLQFGVIHTHRMLTDLKSENIHPIFTPYMCKDESETYSILVPSQSTITNPRQLAGKPIKVYASGAPDLVHAWYIQLVGAKIPDLLESITPSPKHCIYPVFYAQCDACIVPTHSFEVIKELNPQISQRVRELARSPSLVLAVIFTHSSLPEKERKQFLREGLSYSKEKKGQQLLVLSRVGSLKRFETHHLDGARTLLEKAPK